MQMRTQGSETSQYLEEKKAIYGTFFLNRCFASLFRSDFGRMVRKRHYVQEEGSCDSLNSGERNGISPNHPYLYGWGCRAELAFSCNELQIVCIGKCVGKHDPRR